MGHTISCLWCGEPAEAGAPKCPHCGEHIACEVHPQKTLEGHCAKCDRPVCPKCVLGSSGGLCSECDPGGGGGGSAAEHYDIGRVFGWVTNDPDWVGKVAWGGLCLLGGCFFLIPIFFLDGYKLRIARQQWRRPGAAKMPEWDRPGELFVDGFRHFVTMMLPMFLGLVASVAIGGGVAALAAVLGGDDELAVIGLFVGYGLFLLFALAFNLLAPAIEVEYLRSGEVLAGLRWGRIWRRVSPRLGDFLMLFLYFLLFGFVGQLGAYACYVGMFATVPWSMYAQGCTVGRYLAKVDEEEREAKAGRGLA